jgi:hypothetical protein
MVGDSANVLRGFPVLLVQVDNRQFLFLARIYSNPVYDVTADNNILGA